MDSEEWKMLKQAAIRFELKTGEYSQILKISDFLENFEEFFTKLSRAPCQSERLETG